jgi:C_GCAxxG_C_C family probable redox protein
MSKSGISRRKFVSAIPLTVLAAPTALTACEGREAETEEALPQPILQSQGPGFVGPFSAEEAAAVAASPMAAEIAGLNGRGHPCSEMILLAALRRFDLPENHLDAAAVFGGGVGKRSLCGLLTGGLMAIGFAAGARYEDRSQVHQVGRTASNALWDWWLTRGDVDCMGPGTEHGNTEEFVRMCQRVAVKVEEVIDGIVLA